jgi:hypothetical protein
MADLAEAREPRRRKKPGEGGRDPLILARAPPSLIALTVAKARERRLSVSEVIRQALERYIVEDAA